MSLLFAEAMALANCPTVFRSSDRRIDPKVTDVRDRGSIFALVSSKPGRVLGIAGSGRVALTSRVGLQLTVKGEPRRVPAIFRTPRSMREIEAIRAHRKRATPHYIQTLFHSE